MQDNQKQYITASAVCARYGGITTMTLHRWLSDDSVEFPRPMQVNRQRFFDVTELDAFDLRMRTKVPAIRANSAA
ncbi:DNA-binding protein [Pararhizobium sp.]|uniref:DNA-binding protein n=1 Tax=Pararhizobium sp. TaxID=1977563 RepID=UPI003D11961C